MRVHDHLQHTRTRKHTPHKNKQHTFGPTKPYQPPKMENNTILNIFINHHLILASSGQLFPA